MRSLHTQQTAFDHRLTLLACLILALALALTLPKSVTARGTLPQESPLSPLAPTSSEAGINEPLPVGPVIPPQTESRSPYPAPIAEPSAPPLATLPLGEPLMAQTSMVLVGLVVVGLLGVVVVIVLRRQRE